MKFTGAMGILGVALMAASFWLLAGQNQKTVTVTDKVSTSSAVDKSVLCDFMPPAGFASDEWVSDQDSQQSWVAERKRREDEIARYLQNENSECAKKLGFREGQNPKLAWEYFSEHPIGYGGVPYVLLQTLLSLDPATETNQHLRHIACIWKKASKVPTEAWDDSHLAEVDSDKRCLEHPASNANIVYTLDHLGMGARPDTVALYGGGDTTLAQHHRANQLLPNGLVYDPEVEPQALGYLSEVMLWLNKDWRRIGLSQIDDADDRDSTDAAGWQRKLFRWRAESEQQMAWERLEKFANDPRKALIRRKIGFLFKGFVHESDYDRDVDHYQKPPTVDAVFFSCAACHQGRLIVNNKMTHPIGVPNTEIEAQYYSKLLMQTGFALLKSGWDENTDKDPSRQNIVNDVLKDEALNEQTIRALYERMIQRAIQRPEVVYGPGAIQINRAILQTYWVADDFAKHIVDLIGIAIKTQYVYQQIAARHSYRDEKPLVMNDRIGQMDAFGIASGLVAIHTFRPDGSFLRFLCRDNPLNPLFGILKADPGKSCDPEQLEVAAARIRETMLNWAPSVPAPIDIPSLNWMSQRKLANWDGNQGAAARTLASGTSATGDPSKVNVRIHEPLNPMLNYLPPPPYPFDNINREKAQKGKELFYGKSDNPDYRFVNCSECHRPHTDEIIALSHEKPSDDELPLSLPKNLQRLLDPPACLKPSLCIHGDDCDYPELCVDGHRTLVNTPVSRFALAGLVMEACQIFVGNTGNDWCLPHDEKGRVIRDWAIANDNYFKDTPGRIASGTNGYKIDMQHGIWARAPYLHNGSIPTLGHLLCPTSRPEKFYRGIVSHYDQNMVGFEWAEQPKRRFDGIQQSKEYDTTVTSRSNRGHEYGRELCPPEIKGLNPIKDRELIARKIHESPAGDLIEYMKTF